MTSSKCVVILVNTVTSAPRVRAVSRTRVLVAVNAVVAEHEVVTGNVRAMHSTRVRNVKNVPMVITMRTGTRRVRSVTKLVRTPVLMEPTRDATNANKVTLMQ